LFTTVIKKINNISISIPLHYFEFGSMETLAQRVDDKVVLTTFELFHTQNANKVNIPPILYTFCKHTLIFEMKLTTHNLKERFQTYTVIRTFIPKNIIQHDSFFKEIKQITIFIIFIFLCFIIMVDYFSFIKYISLVVLLCQFHFNSYIILIKFVHNVYFYLHVN